MKESQKVEQRLKDYSMGWDTGLKLGLFLGFIGTTVLGLIIYVIVR